MKSLTKSVPEILTGTGPIEMAGICNHCKCSLQFGIPMDIPIEMLFQRRREIKRCRGGIKKSRERAKKRGLNENIVDERAEKVKLCCWYSMLLCVTFFCVQR